MHQSTTYQYNTIWKSKKLKLKHDIEVHSKITGTIHGSNCMILDDDADVEVVEESEILSS